MEVLSIKTATHGRVLVRNASVASSPARCLVGFHGYGQSAEDMLTELERIPGHEKWTIVSVQALHRFYARGRRVVASWMTREDRESAIADNMEYVHQAVTAALAGAVDARIVFIGFSQGVAMAYRAAVNGTYQAPCVIAIGADVPPELQLARWDHVSHVFIGAGESDEWYTPEKLEADQRLLRSVGARFEVFRYAGGHEWTASLRERIQGVLETTST